MGLNDDSRLILDPVRPGEQWFCYWKTSASLWEMHIQEFNQHEIIFIPLYWGLHADGEGQWDFGQNLPERDLVRLVYLLTQHGRKFVWLLPLTPAPFLPNGGVPTSAARTLSVSAQGMHLVNIGQDGSLYKMYSFFAPKVFQKYASFVKAFADVLKKLKINTSVWGADFYYLEDQKHISLLNDSSIVFEQGFSRYLKQNYPQGLEINQARDEQKMKKMYHLEVEKLFRSTAAEALGQYWKGVKDITIFGAGPRETIERALSSGKSQTRYFYDLFHSLVSQHWFSTCLLMPSEKKDLFSRCLNEHFAHDEISYRFQFQVDSRELSHDFRPLILVDVFDFQHAHFFEKNGLKEFLTQHYPWMFYLHRDLDFTPDAIDGAHHRVKIFQADGMERGNFVQMLKLFMMGQQVIFDRTNLSEELDKRLEVFLAENNLKSQSVNFITSIHLIELGEGRLVIYEGEKLKSSPEKEKFWFHIFKYLNLNHPQVHQDKEVFGLWRIRATSSHELNYLDVRRANFYNPTSYKKSVTIQTQKQFAFMKVIDPLHASAKTSPDGVEVEILPHGKIALEFGHYEEKS